MEVPKRSERPAARRMAQTAGEAPVPALLSWLLLGGGLSPWGWLLRGVPRRA